ncbi:MAG: GNAT family N-acetyltransferase [Magnetovibrio sp.]|nr:GNAT family N-acetyltransferase [Magnetovibrio sp.]|tara:strand:- start:4783 stop:7467 length:2685 start_codon:yes stop_codon:yes gene_type:complete
MTVRNLRKLFHPTSVAVIGASERKGAVGNLVMHNLLEGGFDGPIMPVNPKRRAVAGVLTYPDVASLPVIPDLAVICTPPGTVPKIIDDLGKHGTRAAIVLTAGLGATPAPGGSGTAQAEVLAMARRYGMRLLGPNCLGLLVPGIGLNASFAHLPALPGNIAFASQSGAMCTAVLDWARARGIGFSHFISMGDALDTDFGDVLDYLGSDPGTRAILLYVESIHERRSFMSAGRAASRNKPVLVIKAGRSDAGARAAQSHTGALAGSDAVYDAAFRRAGMLRVDTIEEIFAAVETLARAPKFPGDRLAIVTNGGGIGVMAVDRLAQTGGRLAEFSDATIAALDKVLPASWSHGNPADIIGDAPPERYAAAMRAVLAAKEADAILVMHAPTATASSTAAAQAVIDVARETKAPVLANWVGQEAVAPARKMLRDAGVPTYDTPGEAIGAFMHLITYKRNQETLTETPTSLPAQFNPATAVARVMIEGHLASGDAMMSEPAAKSVLAAYGIPTVETHIVTTPAEAAAKAQAMGFPVALKILSPDISHKSDVGGVDLFLDTAEAVTASAERMFKIIGEKFPDARIEGFTVQRMADRAKAHELIVGVTCDAIFGPVILFGQGGTAVEVIADRAVSLPPLNMHLARDLVSRTRVWRLLQGYRDRPPVDMDALCLTLVQISQMIVDIPEIMELDINPLLADENGVLALDARIRVARPTGDRSRDLAIRPYPAELEEPFTLHNGLEVLLRPIRPEDEPEHREFLGRLTPEDIRFRFFGLVREFPHSEIARLTQIDYDREMAFIASAPKADGSGSETLGVVRTVTDPDNETCEFAIIVRSDLKGQGLGYKLLEKMIGYCRARGTKTMAGQVMAGNHPMLDMVRALGFRVKRLEDEPVMETTLDLA